MNFLDTLSGWIDALSARVFAKVPFFGTEIEGIVLWLAVPMVFFTVWLGFIQIRGLPLAWRVVRGHFHDPDAPGSVSQFEALSTALSGTLGLGNIAGVAIAIALGGPGAAFWQFVIGIFAMALKCAEVTLGLKYRVVESDGTVHGGPMYALKRGLSMRGLPRTGAMLGVAYAIFALGGALPMVQTNQSFAQVADVTGFDNGLAYGILMALAVGAVVVGGVRWLGRVTSLLVPAMSAIYMGAVVVVLAVFWRDLDDALLLIVRDAFDMSAVAGGGVGAFIAFAVGMRRAVYSCEAGIGSAVIAHSAAKTREPVSEGLVALLEPLFDTVIMCSMTALMIVVTGVWDDGPQDIKLASDAFATVIGWFPYVLAVAVFLFAYATLIAWGYYGLQAWGFLFGHSRFKDGLYKLLYCAALPLGSVLDITRVVGLVDSVFFLMAIPNIIGLYLFAGEIRADVNGYLRRMKNAPSTVAAGVSP